jgi:hypothetical protein
LYTYQCIQGLPQSTSDAPIAASYTHPAFDRSTTILTWSGSTTAEGQGPVCGNATSCVCSDRIPTNSSALWFTTLTYEVE